MKHVPIEKEHEVNVTQEHPFKDIFLYVLGGIGFLSLAYFIFGIFTNLLVSNLSLETEDKLYGLISKMPHGSKDIRTHASQKRLESILEKLLNHSDLNNLRFKISITNSKKENAFAYPNGTINVHSQLIDNSKSDIELAMVLAHELGHYKNRDHLRGMGRGLFLLMLSTLLSIDSNTLTKFMTMVLGQIELSFNRDQELEADRYGLMLTYKAFGNTKGVLDFFKRLAARMDGLKKIAYYFSTHPLPKERIVKLEKMIQEISGSTVYKED